MAQLSEEKIIDRWTILIDGASGRSEEALRGVVENINKLQPEEVELKRESVMPEASFVSFLKKQKREFLIAINKHLKHYKVYIGAKDYGKQLLIAWYLVCEPGLFGKLAQKMAQFRFMPTSMNLFDLEELTAYVTTVHYAVRDAAKQIAESVGFDFTKVDQKSRGFLNIS
jgi:hypothetical protein